MASKRFCSNRGSIARLALAVSKQLAEKPLRQQPRVFAEHAEHELHQEVGGPQRLDPLVAHPVSQLGEPLGRLYRDLLAGDAGPQRVGVGKEPAEDVEVGRVGQTGQVEDMHLLGRAREVRVDLEAVHVANDQQRRVLQGFAVEL